MRGLAQLTHSLVVWGGWPMSGSDLTSPSRSSTEVPFATSAGQHRRCAIGRHMKYLLIQLNGQNSFVCFLNKGLNQEAIETLFQTLSFGSRHSTKEISASLLHFQSSKPSRGYVFRKQIGEGELGVDSGGSRHAPILQVECELGRSLRFSQKSCQ